MILHRAMPHRVIAVSIMMQTICIESAQNTHDQRNVDTDRNDGNQLKFSHFLGRKTKETFEKESIWQVIFSWNTLKFAIVAAATIFACISFGRSGAGDSIPMGILIPTIVLPTILLGLNMWELFRDDKTQANKAINVLVDVGVIACVMLLAFLPGWTHKIWLSLLCSGLLLLKSYRFMINAPVDPRKPPNGDHLETINAQIQTRLYNKNTSELCNLPPKDAFHRFVEYFTDNGTPEEIKQLKRSVRKNRARSLKLGTTYKGVPTGSEQINPYRHTDDATGQIGRIKSAKYYILPKRGGEAVACDYNVYKKFFGTMKDGCSLDSAMKGSIDAELEAELLQASGKLF